MFKWRQYAAREMWKQNVQQEENDIEGEGGSFTSLMTAILTAECLIRYPTTWCIRKHSEKELNDERKNTLHGLKVPLSREKPKFSMLDYYLF